MIPPGQQTPETRRPFLKTLLYLSLLPVLWTLHTMLRRAKMVPEVAEAMLVVPYVPTPGIRFYDQVIVSCTPQGLAVFATSCPHLGCHINRLEGDELVCPCHGSRFNARGEVLHSPAMRNLQPLQFQYDRGNAVLRINLKNA